MMCVMLTSDKALELRGTMATALLEDCERVLKLARTELRLLREGCDHQRQRINDLESVIADGQTDGKQKGGA